jgi:uncharacterized cofD-like protein
MKVVTIGGGTGSSVVVSALKSDKEVEISAIVAVSDNGGSTGRLRDEFGFLPVGDLRQALAALATDTENDWIRKVLLYRFEKGSGLEGHNLGNLLLTALQDMSGSTESALDIASSIFRLQGKVLPITTDNTQIEIEYENGEKIIGEKNLDDNNGGNKIKQIKLVPSSKIYKNSKEAMLLADYIIIGPGDLYGSIMANLVVGGVKNAFLKSKAKVIYVLSLMTKYTQTFEMSAVDHLKIIEKAIGKKVDFILVNNAQIPSDILNLYKSNNDFPVIDNLGNDKRVYRANLIKPVKVAQSKKDTVPRSYLRHDSEKLKSLFKKIVKKH